ncbi:glycogen synthase [Dokdonia pacifica]|uniref:Glycogen synthase n=1 Tax=Dokdonia pacifica TaxID=1627892 RepID=A0A238ZDC5_9FLAO|nr:glycogen synthase [Dokdonia pacifica]GGG05734.1 glycogen synthase [Dokdonia pacifica]SNR81290.1 starch synthase [Dokdonia pacifica]
MKIIHISAECYPIAKVGGLADVVGALPKYQNRIGHQATVLMPYYETAYVKKATAVVDFCYNLVMDQKTYFAEVLSVNDASLGFPLFLVRIAELTDRKEVYGYEDDALRFVAFQRVALQWIMSKDAMPDVVHCHDHHTGLVPFMMSRSEPFETLKDIPTVLSIHNAQYQGQFSHEMGGVLPRFRESDLGLLDWDGMINPLAAAIKCAWRVNTVSPSYMEELKQKANGLEWLLNHESDKCVGILNGIDAETWDPATDTYLHKNYTIRTRQSGRKTNKEALCEEFGLDSSKPLFGFIGRLVWEKGADILPAIIDKALQDYDINIILLGSGSPEVESQLKTLAIKYKGRYNAYIGYQERMSHQVYAGADFLLMPSRVEPCGLNQMYSLRYGCMPIVRRTGGLKDTVIDLGEKGGFGICHDHTSEEDVVYSIGRAVTHFENQKKFKEIQKTMMHLEHSWENSAQMYVSLYNQLK